jgi:hypothetical protein
MAKNDFHGIHDLSALKNKSCPETRFEVIIVALQL